MNTPHHTPAIRSARKVRGNAFTLIELLVVISIIGILTALVIAGASSASGKRALEQTRAQKNQIVTAIDSYHGKFGTYPPDNPANTAMNTLFYELTGVNFVNNIANPALATFTPILDPTGTLTTANIQAAFSVNVQGIINTGQGAQQPKTFLHNLRAGKDYQQVTSGGVLVWVLTPAAQPNTGVTNTWRYDASSNARHNRTTYDVWTEVVIKGHTNIIGNW